MYDSETKTSGSYVDIAPHFHISESFSPAAIIGPSVYHKQVIVWK